MAANKRNKQAKRGKAKSNRTLRVTYPKGKTERVPDDGRSFPDGTMIVWDETQPSGHDEMRWTVTGGGWPFDD